MNQRVVVIGDGALRGRGKTILIMAALGLAAEMAREMRSYQVMAVDECAPAKPRRYAGGKGRGKGKTAKDWQF